MIRITSKKDGFRRCGVAHPAAPTDYPDDRFTPEHLAALEAEPMLVVQRLDDPKATESEKESDPGKGKGKGKKNQDPGPQDEAGKDDEPGGGQE